MKLTYAQIEAGDFGDEFKQPPIAPADQVRKLDVDASPDAYRGNLGDSAASVVAALLRG